MRFEPTSIVLGAGTTYVLAHPTTRGKIELDRTLVFEVRNDETTQLLDLELEVTGIAFVAGALYAVDADANMHCYAGGKWTDWCDVGDGVPRINALRASGERVYGLTSEGVVCEWMGRSWQALTPNDDDTYLFDLALDGSGRLIASGDNGFLAAIERGNWKRIEVPSEASLTSVLALGPESLLVTGWSGTVLVGERDTWRSLDVGRSEATFLNAVRWSNRVLIAADEEVLELEGAKLSVFAKEPVRRLASDGTSLWKHTNAGIARYDGKRWKPVPLKM